VPYDEAKGFLENLGYNLELAVQNFYDSRSQESTDNQQTHRENGRSIIEDVEEVRPVIPREFDILIQSETARDIQLSAVRQQFSSSFRDLKREMEIQEELARGGAPKRKCLEMIYKHPVDIAAYNLDLTQAKLRGQQLGKWVAVLINNESIESLSFNRDIFNDESGKVKKILKKNFIFLRRNCDDLEALKILQIYNLLDCQTIPIFLIIDSLTGELRKNFQDCTKLTVRSIMRELKKYSCKEDNQLVYNSAVEDSDDEINEMKPCTSQQSTNSVQNSTQKVNNVIKSIDSDEEDSFASLSSDDVSENGDSNDDSQEVKVLDSEDEILARDDEPQTNVLLRLEHESHKFKYPSTRTVGNLINYIYRNYLVKTGIYDNKTKRFSLISKIHNNKCLTSLDHDLTLQRANIHPSIVLLHNTLDKD